MVTHLIETAKERFPLRVQYRGPLSREDIEEIRKTCKLNCQSDSEGLPIYQIQYRNEDAVMNNEVYLLIVGSRNIDDYPYIKSYLNNLVRERYQDCNITVVSGGAKGVDKFAERWADENGYWKIVMPANWDRYGKSAGYRRNEEMHRFIADKENRLVVAFWDGKSKGTAHNFELAKRYGNEIITVLMEDEK